MRDLKSYENNYIEPGFEDIQVRYRRKKILESLEKYRPKKVVEIGCGMEPIFCYYQDFDEYWFFEPADIFFKEASNRIGPMNVKGYNEPFSFKEDIKTKEPDFIICTSLLHELEKPEDLLRDIVNLSNEHTIIHINVPNASSVHRILARLMGIIEREDSLSERNIKYQQNRVYDKDTIIDELRKSNLEVVEQGTIFVKPFTHQQMWNMVKKEIIDTEVLDGLYSLSELPEFENYGSELWMNCKVKK